MARSHDIISPRTLNANPINYPPPISVSLFLNDITAKKKKKDKLKKEDANVPCLSALPASLHLIPSPFSLQSMKKRREREENKLSNITPTQTRLTTNSASPSLSLSFCLASSHIIGGLINHPASASASPLSQSSNS